MIVSSKYEQFDDGCERSLIIQHCSKTDFATYAVRPVWPEMESTGSETGSELYQCKLSLLRNYFKKSGNVFFHTKLLDDSTYIGGNARFTIFARDHCTDVKWLKSESNLVYMFYSLHIQMVWK